MKLKRTLASIRRRIACLFVSASVIGLEASTAKAATFDEPLASETILVDTVEIVGNTRTTRATITELLPRQPPAPYTREEIRDLERRLNNLEIFDRVEVGATDAVLRVVVREKWTLIPNVEFSSGKTFEDSRILLGATEYNFAGRADSLTISLMREQRGYSASLAFTEHLRRRWSFSSELFGGSAQYRFDEGGSWNSLLGGTNVTFSSPPVLSPYFNVSAGGYYIYETTSDRLGTNVPARAHTGGTSVEFGYNRYEFHDLVSSGVKMKAALYVGALLQVPRAQPRHSIDMSVIGGIPLAERTVLMARLTGGIATLGNANYSYLMGSIDGVRGLEDNLYRNWTQAVANVELRQGFMIATRWAIQGVLFTDAGAAGQLDADGQPDGCLGALSFGVGLRLVPTWLASTVLRLDGAYLVAPIARPFLQFGLSQYF